MIACQTTEKLDDNTGANQSTEASLIKELEGKIAKDYSIGKNINISEFEYYYAADIVGLNEDGDVVYRYN